MCRVSLLNSDSICVGKVILLPSTYGAMNGGHLYLVVILCDNLMHPAEVVVWLKKPAKLLGKVF